MCYPVIIANILLIITFILLLLLGLKYRASLPQISCSRKLKYTYQLRVEMLNGKELTILIYSDSSTLQINQIFLNSYCCKISYSVIEGNIIHISTTNTTYRIPEKQILSKQLILINDTHWDYDKILVECKMNWIWVSFLNKVFYWRKY